MRLALGPYLFPRASRLELPALVAELGYASSFMGEAIRDRLRPRAAPLTFESPWTIRHTAPSLHAEGP
ncbi:hypothetical protein DLE60_17575 [Micromonospora globispora]|uniref:Uncharacterized protein n=1 Tax=Micromonospora globispora TaxID=1450148 RepID=A0A317JZ58_9ACTN|nr:hypothetical protein [Micromonospora globispora]PWU45895.1 hypothetical protein DLJ46_19825 [Micromonospora globispora]PWU59218.1 hypothetical protein DLE60_17575 [Micromonospora globispora]RQX05961.1 hypothetical protein DKL51_01945 [Micromonospora globispora]